MKIHPCLAAASALALLALHAPSPRAQEPAAATPATTADDPILLGKGAHRYAWVRDWPQLPDGVTTGNTHGAVLVDARGRVYVNTDTERAVMVFEPDGTYVEGWGAELKGGAHGMTFVQDGDETRLWIAHTGRHEVVQTTLDGEVVRVIPWPQESGLYDGPGKYRPTAVAVAPDGRIFVGDGYGLSYVHVFDADGTYVKSFGGRGKEPGKMRTPHGLWVDTRGETPTLLVADRENGRLQRFTLDGELLGVISGMFRRPCTVQARGAYLVVADLAGRVTILDGEDRLVTHLGDQPDPELRARNGIPREKWQDGLFLAPHCAAFGPDGDVYVVDWNAVGRITRLRPAPEPARASGQRDG